MREKMLRRALKCSLHIQKYGFMHACCAFKANMLKSASSSDKIWGDNPLGILVRS